MTIDGAASKSLTADDVAGKSLPARGTADAAKSVAGRSVLVTGAGEGFGTEVAFRLASDGFRVYAGIADMAQRADLEAAARRRKVQVRVLHVDTAEAQTIDEALRVIVAECGSVYGAVNSELLVAQGFFEDWRDDEIRPVFETNLFGTMAVTRAVLPYMRKARQGRIVMITSVAGLLAVASGAVYSASKFAEEGFAESLRQEVAPFGIQVSTVLQGVTASAAWGGLLSRPARAADSASPYAGYSRRSNKMFDNAFRGARVSAADIAACISRAMTDAKPRHRYPVGIAVKGLLTLRRYIPGEAFDRFYAGQVKRRIVRD